MGSIPTRPTYRVRQRERNVRLVDPADAPRAVVDGHLLRERTDELTDERDRLWAPIVRLQQHIRDLERSGSGPPPTPQTSDQSRPLSKPLGWLSTAVFLEVNGIEISAADNDAVYELVIEVAAAQPSVDEIAQQLRGLIA